MSKPVRITFVRHGESTSNLARLWQGQGNSPLSGLGKQQASALARRLAGRHFDRVIASDLYGQWTRPVPSDFLRAGHGVPRVRRGVLGRTHARRISERYPGKIARLKQGEDLPLGGGESFATFSARCRPRLGPRARGGRTRRACDDRLSRWRDRRGPLGLLGLRRRTALSARQRWQHVDQRGRAGRRARGRRGAACFNDARHIAHAHTLARHRDQTWLHGAGGERPTGFRLRVFAAHYDVWTSLLDPVSEGLEPHPEQRLRDIMGALRTLHPERRVSVSCSGRADPSLGVECSLADATGERATRAAAQRDLCHVGSWGEGAVLHDYGVLLDWPRYQGAVRAAPRPSKSSTWSQCPASGTHAAETGADARRRAG